LLGLSCDADLRLPGPPGRRDAQTQPAGTGGNASSPDPPASRGASRIRSQPAPASAEILRPLIAQSAPPAVTGSHSTTVFVTAARDKKPIR
jgi:hypothetical protein